MQLRKKVKRLRRRLEGESGPTRISRERMPNGFFLNDLLWFGDGGSEKQQSAVVLLSNRPRWIRWTMKPSREKLLQPRIEREIQRAFNPV